MSFEFGVMSYELGFYVGVEGDFDLGLVGVAGVDGYVRP